VSQTGVVGAVPQWERAERDFGPLGSALLWLCVCAFSGVAAITAGVFILAGVGWALIAVGVFLFAVAGLIRTGIVNG